MVKTKNVETTETYDKDGNLIEKVTREETTEDDTVYTPTYPQTPWVTPTSTGWWNNPTCVTTSTTGECEPK